MRDEGIQPRLPFDAAPEVESNRNARDSQDVTVMDFLFIGTRKAILNAADISISVALQGLPVILNQANFV